LPTIIIYDTFELAMTLLIREYLTADGRNPFREWLNRLGDAGGMLGQPDLRRVFLASSAASLSPTAEL
jgi:hypothetical protein